MDWMRMGRRALPMLITALSVFGTVFVLVMPSGAGATTNDSCGYDASTFTESTVMRGAQINGFGQSATLSAYANDEKGLLLGTNGATPNTSNPQSVHMPNLGDASATDTSGRPIYPSLYITDITNDPSSTTGDFQYLQAHGLSTTPANVKGGVPYVDDLFGTWTTGSGNPSAGTYSVATLPAGSNVSGSTWNLGAGSDAPGASVDTSNSEAYTAEIRWNVSELGLQTGHTYRIQIIEHDGDQNKTGGDAGEACLNLTVPGITTTATNGAVGQPVTDLASIIGTGGKSGNVTWSVYNDNAGNTTACTQANLVTTLSPALHITGDTSGMKSPSWTPQTAGNYQWQATYVSDDGTLTVKSDCQSEPFTVDNLTTQASPGTVGQSVSDTATLTGVSNPTGSLTWTAYSDAGCTQQVFSKTTSLPANLTNIQGPSFKPSTAGSSYEWIVTYNASGSDTNNATVSTNCGDEPFTVDNLTTTPVSTGVVDKPINDTATLTGVVNPTGSLTWTAYSDASCTQQVFTQDTSLPANLTNIQGPSYTPTAVGNYNWVVTYNANGSDTTNAKVVSQCGAEPFTITPATPTVATTASDGIAGQPVTDIATVTGGFNPTGTITWKVYADNASNTLACTTPVATISPSVSVNNTNNNGQAIQSPAWNTPTGSSTQYYQWVAYYVSSDGNNVNVDSGCNNEPFKLTPTPAPAITIQKLESFSPSGGFSAGPLTGQVGQTVYYEMLVTDTGNTDVRPSFSDPGCDSSPVGPTQTVPTYNAGTNTLSSGGQVAWTCSHVLTAADVSGYTNTARVTGTVVNTGTPIDNSTAPCADGSAPPCSSSVIAYSSSPGMQVVKLQSLSAQGPFTTSQLTGSVGDTVYYEIQVTNTGNEPLTLSISDPHCDSTPAGPTAVSGSLSGNVLAPGGVAQYTCSHVLAASDMPSFTNVGTITGQPQCPPAANSCPPLSGTGIVVANVTQANIQVLKLQSLSASGPFTTSQLTAKVGQTIYYEIQATNTGNAPLTLSITDPECDAGTLSQPVALTGSLSGDVLSPGGEAQYTCSHVLRKGDASPFTNTATVIGTPPSGPPVSGTSSVTTKKAAVLPIRLCRAPSGKVVRYHGTKKPRACKRISKPPKHIRGFTGRASWT
jgi:uncharacterized repeat protein (TIGR01451 family)